MTTMKQRLHEGTEPLSRYLNLIPSPVDASDCVRRCRLGYDRLGARTGHGLASRLTTAL